MIGLEAFDPEVMDQATMLLGDNRVAAGPGTPPDP
jgi:hypothetical protein